MDKQLVWFESLYERYADAIWRHLYLRLGDRERAKELMQDVFLKTWQYVMLGRTIDNERAFLYKVAKNLFINEIRTDKKTMSLDRLSEEGHEMRDEQSLTGSYAEHRELLERLHHIKDSYRTVLVMRFIDGLAVNEIADILDEHETNISMRIKRGLTALKTTYETSPPQL